MSDNSPEIPFYDKWRAKLEKEIKKGKPEDRKAILENGIHYDPFIDPARVPVPDLEITPPASFSIGFDLGKRDDALQNEVYRYLLEYGLRLIHISADDETEWDILLEGIFPEMIFLDITFMSENAVRKFESWRARQKMSDNWTVGVESVWSLNDSNIYKTIDLSGFGTADQVEVLRKLNQQFNDWKGGNALVKIRTGPALLEVLPFARALHQIISGSRLENSFRLSSIADLPGSLEGREEEVIASTTAAVWAVMAGFDQIYFRFDAEDIDREHLRILLNIQHLIAMESKMIIDNDPLKGAWIIEDLTAKLLQEVKKNKSPLEDDLLSFGRKL